MAQTIPTPRGNARWIAWHQRGLDCRGRAMLTHRGGRPDRPSDDFLDMLHAAWDQQIDTRIADTWLTALVEASGVGVLAAVLARLPRRLQKLRDEVACLKRRLPAEDLSLSEATVRVSPP
jgi:hypothetical protein